MLNITLDWRAVLMSEYWELKEKGLVKVLTLNSVRCLVCNEVLVSKSQHHYVQCQCPNGTATDGGLLYQRYMGCDLDKVENLSKYIIMTEQEYDDMLEKKRIKDEEILQQKIDAGLMVNVGNDINPHWVSKEVWDIVTKVSSKYYLEVDKRGKK